MVAGVIALVAAFASRLRPLGPAARHALWLVVLVKLVTPPLVRSPWAVPVAVRASASERVGMSRDDESSISSVGLPNPWPDLIPSAWASRGLTTGRGTRPFRSA